MSLWEWVPSLSSSKQIVTRNGARGTSAYGTVRKFDQTAPASQVTLTAEGMTWTEAMAVKAIHDTASDGDDGDDYTATDYLGATWVGPIVSFKTTSLEGTELLAVEIVIDDPAYTGPA